MPLTIKPQLAVTTMSMPGESERRIEALKQVHARDQNVEVTVSLVAKV